MKKLSLLLFTVLVALGVSAQEVKNSSNGTVYLKDKATDHWFMGISGGTNLYMTKGENDADADFADRLGWMAQIEFGKWVSPNWGSRLVIEGGKIAHVAPGIMYTNSDVEQNWVGTHLDLMYNLTNGLGGYNANRVWNIYPYLGIGYMYGMSDWKKPYEDNDVFKHQNQTLTYNVGLINDFKFNSNISMFIELGYRLMQESFDLSGTSGDYEYDGMFTGLAGLRFGLGKQEFTPAELMDYNLINDLNSQINRLRAENEELSKRPVSCPDCQEVTTAAPAVYVPNVVFFRINSAKIDKNQQISVYNTAEYLKNNPNAKVKIVAYADRQTGNPDYNMALSERRAKSVSDALVNEYGIDSSRISLEWKGDTEQPYAENDWNRVAIFYHE